MSCAEEWAVGTSTLRKEGPMCKAVSRACVRKGAFEGYQVFACARNNNPGLKYLVTRRNDVLFSFSPGGAKNITGRWRYRGHQNPVPRLGDAVPETVIRVVEEMAASLTNEEIRRYNAEMEKRGMRNRATFLPETAI